VQQGEGHAEQRRHRHDPVQEMGQAQQKAVIAQRRALDHDRQHFHHQHGGVEDDAQRNLPQHRVHVPEQQRVIEAVWPADVHQQGQHRPGVAQQADHHGGAGDGLVPLEAEDVHRRREGKGPRAQGDRGQIDRDPQAPGKLVGQVGHPQATGQHGEDGGHADSQQEHQEEDPGGVQRRAAGEVHNSGHSAIPSGGM